MDFREVVSLVIIVNFPREVVVGLVLVVILSPLIVVGSSGKLKLP